MLPSFVQRNGVAKAAKLLVTFCCIFLLSNASLGYSVLTHEFIIDFLWKDQIRSVLLTKFPDTTPDELKEAHAYAYGGAGGWGPWTFPFLVATVSPTPPF